MESTAQRFFEDFEVGLRFRSGATVVTAERIKSFAAEFDPQPFHLDEDAAGRSFFAGLAASGWHTAAIVMRLIVESDLRPAGGTIGAGVEDIRWPRAVRPGDVLHVEGEVLEMRASRSRPELGIVKIRVTALNQAGEPVQISTPVLMVRRRP
ncbi:MAG TPA: MaoC family dehydratase [Polyangia bacterium]|jgi:acyl dehydratase|nr:MaoC family dehydratase [Polyangia bacterium]